MFDSKHYYDKDSYDTETLKENKLVDEEKNLNILELIKLIENKNEEYIPNFISDPLIKRVIKNQGNLIEIMKKLNKEIVDLKYIIKNGE